ncbi:hypothetical protein, partial [Nocardia cyriacigeorgica]|uniref:hypothetical protein n=1 Tax=Nocardia cyriacigeorgica TaxID=135487 RepID=UPI0024563431
MADTPTARRAPVHTPFIRQKNLITHWSSPDLLLDVLARDRQRLDLFVVQFAGGGLVHHPAALGREEALLEIVGGRLELLGRLTVE